MKILKKVVNKRLLTFISVILLLMMTFACHRDQCPCHGLKAKSNIYLKTVGKKFATASSIYVVLNKN